MGFKGQRWISGWEFGYRETRTRRSPTSLPAGCTDNRRASVSRMLAMETADGTGLIYLRGGGGGGGIGGGGGGTYKEGTTLFHRLHFSLPTRKTWENM